MRQIISARGLTKTYKLYHSKTDHALEVFLPFGRRRHKDHHALSDVSFNVHEGESVGIIGRNGSGKSTLLKIISGVLRPTSGEVSIRGTIASLLELGAGFNPELTGRENIYFHGALLGCSKAQMRERADAIIAFADIGEFIDQPVKVYSSGMFVRLAFAVSIHVDPDILIIDEALAVGDVRFQKKCVDFMRAFKSRGKTILFVSHDIYTVKSFCDRLILIDSGRIEALGDPDEVANRYHQLMFPKPDQEPSSREFTAQNLELSEIKGDGAYCLDVDLKESDTQWGSGAVWISRLRVGGVREPNLFNWENALEFEVIYRWDPQAVARICDEQGVLPRLMLGFRLENAQSWVITNFASAMLEDGGMQFDPRTHSECVVRCKAAPIRLASGHYFISPGIAIGTQDHLFPVKEYTNLIHLYCDTTVGVMGQMQGDYTIELLELV